MIMSDWLIDLDIYLYTISEMTHEADYISGWVNKGMFSASYKNMAGAGRFFFGVYGDFSYPIMKS